MDPVRPELDVSIGQEVTIAKNQSPYLPLIAHVYGHECWGDPVVTRWRLSWRERIRALLGGDLYVHVLSFGKPYPPMHLGFDRRTMRYLTADEHARETRTA